MLEKEQQDLARSDVTGAAMVYTTRDEGGNPVPCAVPFTDHYRFRGNCPQLQAMSLNEYISTVMVVEATREAREQLAKQRSRQQDVRRGPGRPALWLREFDPGHPLHETHLQRGRAKLVIPVFGKGVPTIPRIFWSTLTSWATEGDEAAAAQVDRAVAFYSMLLVPWDAATGMPPKETLTLAGLLAYFKQDLADPAECDALRSRWADFRRLSASIYPAPEGTKKVMQAMRDRTRCGWAPDRGPNMRRYVRTGLQGSPSAPWPQHGADAVDEQAGDLFGCDEEEFERGQEDLELQILLANDDKVRGRRKNLLVKEQFSKHTADSTICTNVQRVPIQRAAHIPSLALPAKNVNDKFSALADFEGIEGGAIRRAAEADGTDAGLLTTYARFLLATPNVQDPFTDATRPGSLPKPLTAHQIQQAADILEFFRGPRTGSLAVLLHGPAGTGKTHVYRVLDAALQLLGHGEARAMALTGVACTQLGGKAATLHWHRLLRNSREGGQHNDKPNSATAPSKKTIREIRTRIGEQPPLIWVDEVSMLSAHDLWTIDTRLRRAYKVDQIFGGIPIVFAGDFLQIPCVGTRLLRATCTPDVLQAGPARQLELRDAINAGKLFRELKLVVLLE